MVNVFVMTEIVKNANHHYMEHVQSARMDMPFLLIIHVGVIYLIVCYVMIISAMYVKKDIH